MGCDEHKELARAGAVSLLLLGLFIVVIYLRAAVSLDYYWTKLLAESHSVELLMFVSRANTLNRPGFRGGRLV